MGELYRVLNHGGISPLVADEMELWQIAALLTPTAHEVANDDAEMQRRIVEERYRAAREGRELDPRDMFAGTSEAQLNRQTPA